MTKASRRISIRAAVAFLSIAALTPGASEALTLFDIVNNGSTIDVDDKRFTNWSYSGIINDNVAMTIDVSLLAGDPLNPGFRFSVPSGVPLTSGSNTTSTFQIGFDVQVFTGDAVIEGISLDLVNVSYPGSCPGLPDCGAIFQLTDGGGPLGPVLSFDVGTPQKAGIGFPPVGSIGGFDLGGQLTTNVTSGVHLGTWELRFSQTPEPGSGVLLGAGMIGLLLRRRARR